MRIENKQQIVIRFGTSLNLFMSVFFFTENCFDCFTIPKKKKKRKENKKRKIFEVSNTKIE